MTLHNILLQLPNILPDSTFVGNTKNMEGAIASLSLDDFINKIINGAIDLGFRIIIAIVVFYLGRYIINKIHKVTKVIMIKREIDRSLATFVLSLIKISLLFILIVSVIGILGIETSSFIAIFASAGVAVGLALSGTLQNFAGGVLILLIKPYKIGDFVEFGGYTGTVKEIQIFNTIINTPDNKSIIIPNGGLSTGTINNYSKEEYRRVDWTISIAYGNDFDVARRTALDILHADSRIVTKFREDDKEMRHITTPIVENGNSTSLENDGKRRRWFIGIFHHKLKEKAESWKEAQEKSVAIKITKADCSPSVTLGALASSSIDIVIRAWTRSEFFWSVYYDVNEAIYKEFPKHGLDFPFPQLDIHMSHKES